MGHLFYSLQLTFKLGLKDENIFIRIKELTIPVLLLINKIDLVAQEIVNKEIDRWSNILPKAEIFVISALNNFNIINNQHKCSKNRCHLRIINRRSLNP